MLLALVEAANVANKGPNWTGNVSLMAILRHSPQRRSQIGKKKCLFAAI
jgi:hypothetical protein